MNSFEDQNSTKLFDFHKKNLRRHQISELNPSKSKEE
jgi:hypothetical protein